MSENESKPEAIALFDLDGTLCDFAAGMEKEMKPLEGPGEKWDYQAYDQDTEPDYMRARRRLAKSKPGFWSSLPKYKPGFEILSEVVRHGFRIVIFTKAPLGQLGAFTEKAEWCREHLITFQYDLSMVTDKGLHYGKMLVDDWPPYIEKWLVHRPRGTVIMPDHKYNKDFSHPQVFRYLDRITVLDHRNEQWTLPQIVKKIREQCAP